MEKFRPRSVIFSALRHARQIASFARLVKRRLTRRIAALEPKGSARKKLRDRSPARRPSGCRRAVRRPVLLIAFRRAGHFCVQLRGDRARLGRPGVSGICSAEAFRPSAVRPSLSRPSSVMQNCRSSLVKGDALSIISWQRSFSSAFCDSSMSLRHAGHIAAGDIHLDLAKRVGGIDAVYRHASPAAGCILRKRRRSPQS